MEPLQERPYRAAAVRAAFPFTVPVLTGYLCLGFTFGVLMATKGYNALWAMMMSVVCFAGSAEYVGLTLLSTVFDPFQALLITLMINARHIFYGLSMLGKYKGLGLTRAFLIFGLTDETYSILSSIDPPEGVEPKPFYFWVTFLNYCYWVIGSTLGALAGSVLPFDTTGMDFVLTALFVVLFLEQWKKKENRPAGLIGLGCTIASLLIFGADNLVIPAMVLVLAVLLGGRKRLCS